MFGLKTIRRKVEKVLQTSQQNQYDIEEIKRQVYKANNTLEKVSGDGDYVVAEERMRYNRIESFDTDFEKQLVEDIREELDLDEDILVTAVTPQKVLLFDPEQEEVEE